MKVCATCETQKPLTEFYIHSVSRKPVAHCKPCYQERSRLQHRSQVSRDPLVRKRRGLKHRYNLTIEDVDAMRAEQSNACAACQRAGILYIDHDHATGTVRGLLCPRCNTAMAVLDTEGLLEMLVAYKAKHV